MDITTLLQGTGQPAPAKSEAPDTTTTWRIIGSHMATNEPSAAEFKAHYPDSASANNTYKVAAFDMDDTLICNKSGVKFGKGPNDWKWRTDTVLPVLAEKVKQGKYLMVILTNQGLVVVTPQLRFSSKSFRNLTIKLGQMMRLLDAQVQLRPFVYAALGRPGKAHRVKSSPEQHDHTRKPSVGMWDELERCLKRVAGELATIDKELSFFVGDAAGRDGDHLDVDLMLAQNVGVEFHLPEEFFGK